MGVDEEEVALLGDSAGRRGSASVAQTFGNIIVSIVGTGVLGLPYAYKLSGWAPASAAILLSALVTYYCMMLLISCRKKLEQMGHFDVSSYGDIGGEAYGKVGRYAAETMVVICQCGGCVAYMVFIAQNLSSIFTGSIDKYPLIIYLLIPIEIVLSWIRSLSSLAPLSLLADACNVLAIAMVIKDDLQSLRGWNEVSSFTDWGGLLFAAGVAVFSYEGFSMTLPLESSMRKPEEFGRVLGLSFLVLGAVYTGFGFSGYVAYGSKTLEIITLNLPSDWCTVGVKVGLCIALALTYPVMMHPVHEMFNDKLMATSWFQKVCVSSQIMEKLVIYSLRGSSVILLAIVASSVPGFAVFISLVGSTVSAMLAFVFPTLFHMKILSGCLSFPARAVDILILCSGIAFALYGTVTAINNVFGQSSQTLNNL